MATRVPVSLVWLRRDLRLDDHAVLDAAARASERVACAFVLDPVLLRGPRVGAPIVQCFFDALGDLRERLRAHGTDLVLLEGDAPTELLALARRIGARAVFYGRDVDPDALARDARAEAAFRDRGLLVRAIEDQVYYAADEVTQNSGKPYGVYTPYRRRWEARLAADPRPPLRSERTLAPRLLTRDVLGASREVPRPEDCPPRFLPEMFRNTIMDTVEVRYASGRMFDQMDGTPGSPDSALWARVPGHLSPSAATLAIFGDYVSGAVSQPIGRRAMGRSLDNTLRVVQLKDTEWVLCDIRMHALIGGYGQGVAFLWSEDGDLLATASQSVAVRLWPEDGVAPGRRR